MKALFIFLTINLFTMLFANKVMSQEKPGKGEEKRYYQQIVKGDSIKAGKVQQIIKGYKEAMKAVEEDQKLDLEAKRSKFKALIEGKNRQLEAILTEDELEQLIPETERDRTKKNK